MSRSSTSASDPAGSGGWGRLGRLGLILLALLLGLELIFRTPLTRGLQPYADLLWYDVYLATYNRDLQQGARHDVWLTGSSYMMTGLSPAIVQQELESAGLSLTVQNYGLNQMQNLEVMGEVFDRWLFELDQPDAFVLAVAGGNFGITPRETQPIITSTLERMLIFPASLEDRVGGFLYQNSALVHYGILLRYVLDPRDVAERGYFMNQALPQGGFVDLVDRVYAPDNCNLTEIDDPAAVDARLAMPGFGTYWADLEIPLREMESFIAVVQRRGIPLAMVIIPDQACAIGGYYGSYANYDAMFIEPLQERFEAHGLPVLDLDLPFRAAVPAAEQPNFYANHNHPNHDGAMLFSRWTGEWLADWLSETGGDS